MEQAPLKNENGPVNMPPDYPSSLNQVHKGRGKKKVVLTLILILLVTAGAVAAYVYFEGNDQASDVIRQVQNYGSNGENDQIDREADADTDGLPDYIEEILGTDPGESDSDNDGYDDLTEIEGGYDPLRSSSEKLTDRERSEVKNKIMEADNEFYRDNFNDSQIDSDFVCGKSTVQDVDGNFYNTVKIQNQCWLKENLKVTKNPKGQPIARYCYDNDPSICETDGGLYDWKTAMDGSTQEGVQGICPDDWHVPKDSEFVLGGSSVFEGPLAGFRMEFDKSYNIRGLGSGFWSSTESGSSSWFRNLDHSGPVVSQYTYGKEVGFSVRCLKN